MKSAKVYPILPFYIGFFMSVESLGMVRSLRVLRLLKLTRYHVALDHLTASFKKVKNELTVVGLFVLILVVFGSTIMYELEHTAQPDKFSTHFDSLWWCMVTMTTIGYGDLAPITVAGRTVAMFMMFVGLSLVGTFISLIGSAMLKTDHDVENDAS